MPLKVISSKTIFKASLFEVNEVEVELTGGIRKTYHNVVRRSAVTVIALNENKEIYLVKQFRYLLNKFAIEAIAGFIDANEEPLAAAKRELKEETGLSASRWTQLHVVEMGASVIRVTQSVFLAQDLTQGEQDLDETEEIEVLKIKLQDAMELIEKGEINTAASIIGILMTDKMIKEGNIKL